MDAARIEELYLEYGPMVYRRCLRILGNVHEAEEALQEVFLRILRKLASSGEVEALRNYMFRISTNYCLNRLRDGKKYLRHLDLEHLPPYGGPTPEEQSIVADELEAQFSRLPENRRNIVYLHLGEGLSQEEVAEIVGLSRRTVGKVLRGFVAAARSVGEAN